MPGYKNIVYTNAEELFHQNSAFAKYKDAIHITATRSLKSGMMKSNSELNRWFTGPIISFSELLKYIGGNWSMGKTRLKQHTLLSMALRQYSEEKNIISSHLYSAIDKNQGLILNTIRLLSESGYTSLMVRNTLKKALNQRKLTNQEEILLDLWQIVEKNPDFQNIHLWFNDLNKKPKKVFEKTLVELFQDILKDEKKRIHANIPYDNKAVDNIVKTRLNKRQIVLHGFYFLVPIQKRLFDILSKEFDLIHVVNYHPGFKHGFETIEQFLNIKDLGFERALPKFFTVNYHAKEFLYAINGTFKGQKMITNEKDTNKVNYFEFYNLQQFRKYVQFNNEHFVSPRTMEIRDYLTPIDEITYNKLSEHPLGAFLINIHNINLRRFNVDTSEFEDYENLTHKLLREIFNSGYLTIDGRNGKEALRTLDYLQEVTKDFTTFNEWKDCINNLIQLKEKAEKQLHQNKNSNKKIEHRMYSYYHEAIGYLYCRKKDLLFVKKGLYNIRRLFNELFKGTKINISEYVEILENYVQNDVIPTLSENLDKEIAKNILLALDELKDDSLELDRKDLMLGLRYFLAQSSQIEDEYEAELFGQANADTSDTINSLLNSDGLQFDDNRVIHFALMDNEAFPTSQSLSTWPLSKDSFEILCTNNLYLNQLKMRKDLEVEIACYQFYIIMSNAVKLNFSFVLRLNDQKKLKRSFYLNFLSLIKGSNDQVKQLMQDENKPSVKAKILKFRERRYDILPRQTFNRCPKRLVYSMLIDRRPTFDDSFHEPFLFQQLIQYDQVYVVDEEKRKKLFDLYRSWFPHWSKTKKDINQTVAIDYAKNNPEKIRNNYSQIDGWRYHHIRMKLNLFGSPSEGELFGMVTNVNDYPLTRPGDNCKYCPFQFICVESQLYMPKK